MLLRFHQQSLFCVWVQEAALCVAVKGNLQNTTSRSLKGIFALSECKLVLLCCVCTVAEVCSCSSSGDQATMHLMQTFNVFPDDHSTTTSTFSVCPLNSRTGRVQLSASTYSLFPRTVAGLVFLCWCTNTKGFLSNTNRLVCVENKETIPDRSFFAVDCKYVLFIGLKSK